MEAHGRAEVKNIKECAAAIIVLKDSLRSAQQDINHLMIRVADLGERQSDARKQATGSITEEQFADLIREARDGHRIMLIKTAREVFGLSIAGATRSGQSIGGGDFLSDQPGVCRCGHQVCQ